MYANELYSTSLHLETYASGGADMDLYFYIGLFGVLLHDATSTMYDFNVEHTLHTSDEGYSSAQMISSGFMFFGVWQRQLYV